MGLLIGYGGIFIFNDAHAVVEVAVTVDSPFPSPSSPLHGSVSPCQCAGKGNWMDWPSRLSAREKWNHGFSKRNYSHDNCVSDKRLSTLESPKSRASTVEKNWNSDRTPFLMACVGGFFTRWCQGTDEIENQIAKLTIPHIASSNEKTLRNQRYVIHQRDEELWKRHP